MKKFNSYDEFNESTHTWSGKPLPRDATELKFFLHSAEAEGKGRHQVMTTVPGMTNKKGKSILFASSGWEKNTNDAAFQEAVLKLIVQLLNSPEAKKKLSARTLTSKLGL